MAEDKKRFSNNINIRNRQATFQFELLDKLVAGLALKGTEIKSIREGKVNLQDGYCYLNNAAVAVRALRRGARVAVLDIDVHHGNGTQSMFYRDPKVMVVSLHQHPGTCFPYFAGYPTETGAGPGAGTNLNVTEAAGCDGRRYFELLDRHALPALRSFAPDFLVLSAGLDTYELDPVGHFKLTTDDLRTVGERIGRLGLPTVTIQEGGYHAPHLGRNAVALLDGLQAGLTASLEARSTPRGA